MNIIEAFKQGFAEGREHVREKFPGPFDMDELMEWDLDLQLAFMDGYKMGRRTQEEIEGYFVTCASCGARVARGDACPIDMCGAICMEEKRHGAG